VSVVQQVGVRVDANQVTTRTTPQQGPAQIHPASAITAHFAEAEEPILCCGGGAAPVVEGTDVRKVVCAWLEELVGGYLLRCVETDVGAEHAVVGSAVGGMRACGREGRGARAWGGRSR